MKKISFLLLLMTLAVGCSKEIKVPDSGNEGAKDETKSISVSLVGATNLVVGNEASFVVKNDKGIDINSLSKIFVAGQEITGGKYTPEKEGKVEVYATYKNFTSPKITLDVKAKGGGTGGEVKGTYLPKVVVHDFTGTWCGYCAGAILEIEELHKKYPKNVISVGVHTGGSGPNRDGSFDYDKYKTFGTGNENPVIWINHQTFGAQFEEIVSEFIQAKKLLGLAINYDLKNDKVTVSVQYDKVTKNNKIVVFLVEDKLLAAQANYDDKNKNSLGYGKGNPIANFEHNAVLRTALTAPMGDKIPDADVIDNLYTSEYSLKGKKGKVVNINNTRIVAFVVDNHGTVVNAQVAKVNEDKGFDK